jgi:hypothetical protein
VLEAPVVAGHLEDPAGRDVLAVELVIEQEGERVTHVLLVDVDDLKLAEEQVGRRDGEPVG